MKTIALKLPEALLARIEMTARQRGETRSALVRHAVERLLSNPAVGKEGSCLDLAPDLSGCVKGAPDLSTNQKHMEGYGQ